ncbi:helix-turn-helix domain-containing protein [Emticicia sp. BO119]|uniref:helix-turn-helix domain-containing protein n=1 Tax=Emticicia sp. BO119 TaxID=2757768 RepID=UPI0015F033CF|nr:helix-turn-helix domain-containing protein [Emticicia sp. BO119]MBA4852955.1 AraC family transcriptional regulator [Emticicia sp. BO119]
MNIRQGILFFFSGLGVFNGLLLSAYFLVFKKVRTFTGFLLGVLLLCLSIRVGKSVFLIFKPGLAKIYLQIGLSTCFFIGPTLFYLIKSIRERIVEIPKYWKLNFALHLAIIVPIGVLFTYEQHPDLWGQLIRFIYLQWFLYTLAAGVKMKEVFTKLFNKEEMLNLSEQFQLLLFTGNTIIFLSYLFSLLNIQQGFYITGPLSFTFILYISILFLLKKEKMEINVFAVQDKYLNKKIGDKQAATLVQKLEQILQDQELYKDPNLKLNDLSKKINIPGHQLSQLLNDNLGKSFSTYINEYRINEACRMIIEQPNLTLEAIGYEVGFNAKSTFYTTFKKLRHTTPMLYKENAGKSVNS